MKEIKSKCCNAALEVLPENLLLKDCKLCDACDMVMTCTTKEGDSKYNTALSHSREAINKLRK